MGKAKSGKGRKLMIASIRNGSLKNTSAIEEYFARMDESQELSRRQESGIESEETLVESRGYRKGSRYHS
jgi:hypothetical protein